MSATTPTTCGYCGTVHREDANPAWYASCAWHTRTLATMERIAVALETLASDVKPTGPITGVFSAAADMGAKIAEARGDEIKKSLMQKIAEEASAAKGAATNPQVGVPGTRVAEPGPSAASKIDEPAKVETSATPSPAVEGADTVAASLEAELAVQEDAKAELGDELHALIWGTPHDAPASLATALKIRDAAVKILGGEDAFATIRDVLGVTKGSLPTGAQMRRLAVGFLVPRLKADSAQVGDSWA